MHHCVEVVVGFATGGHHLVVARLGEGKDKRTDDDDCHLVYDMSGATKKETLRFQPVREIIALKISLENLKSICDPVASFPLHEVRSPVRPGRQLGLESLPRPQSCHIYHLLMFQAIRLLTRRDTL